MISSFCLSMIFSENRVPLFRIMLQSLVQLDNRDHRTAAMRALMHGIDRHEHRRIADRQRRHPADRGLGMAVIVDGGIVDPDLPPPPRRTPPLPLASPDAISATS